LEQLLQEVSNNSGLAIPYWDSELDSYMPNPADSAVFTNDLLGTAKGKLNSGPFKDFRGYDSKEIVRDCLLVSY